MRFEISLWKWELGMDLLWVEHGGQSIWRRMIFFRILFSLSPIFNLGFSARSEGVSLNLLIWPFHLDCGRRFLYLYLRSRIIYKASRFRKGWEAEWRGWRCRKEES